MCYGYEYFNDERDSANKKVAKSTARKAASQQDSVKSDRDKVEVEVGSRKTDEARAS